MVLSIHANVGFLQNVAVETYVQFLKREPTITMEVAAVTILAGANNGYKVLPDLDFSLPGEYHITLGDRLSFRVVDDGGGAAPTVTDLCFQIRMWVLDSSPSPTWPVLP